MNSTLKNINFSAGVDEAGRGSWAGPVVAATVALSPNHNIVGLNDSKKLTAKKREELFEEICNTQNFGVGVASVQEIDRINILQATFLAMKRAIDNMSYQAEIYLIDGNINPDLGVNSQAIVRGDATVESIAAASIIAKVTRDRIMRELGVAHPDYNWMSNVGYGTSLHLKAIKKFGVTEHHRRSFKPIVNFLTNIGECDTIKETEGVNVY